MYDSEKVSYYEKDFINEVVDDGLEDLEITDITDQPTDL